MKCKVCNKESKMLCLCGYCKKCIDTYGHEGCANKEKENQKKPLDKNICPDCKKQIGTNYMCSDCARYRKSIGEDLCSHCRKSKEEHYGLKGNLYCGNLDWYDENSKRFSNSAPKGERMSNKEIDRMTEMEEASARHPNLMQTYEIMWKALKEEIVKEKKL